MSVEVAGSNDLFGLGSLPIAARGVASAAGAAAIARSTFSPELTRATSATIAGAGLVAAATTLPWSRFSPVATAIARFGARATPCAPSGVATLPVGRALPGVPASRSTAAGHRTALALLPHHHAADGAAHGFELTTAQLAIVVAVEPVEHGTRTGRSERATLRTAPHLGTALHLGTTLGLPTITRAALGPTGATRAAAFAIAGLSVAVAISLASFRAGASAGAALTSPFATSLLPAWPIPTFAALATLTSLATIASATIGTLATFAGTTTGPGFGPGAFTGAPGTLAGAVATIGVALLDTLAADLASGFAGRVAFFGA